MLQSFRDNLKGVTALILVGIIIIPFAFWGVESLFVSGSSVEQAAKVNDEPISKLDVLRGIETQRSQLLNQFPEMNPMELSDEVLEKPVLNQLIRRKLLELTASEGGMGISDMTFNELVATTEAFQVNGKFDASQYEYLIGQQGFTPMDYRREIKRELLVNQLRAGLQSSSAVTEKQVKRFTDLVLQERSWSYIRLPLERFLAEVSVNEDEVKAYYEANQENFREPDKVVVEYIELTPEVVAGFVEVAEDDVRSRFETESEQASATGNGWRIAHIQVNKTDDGSHVEKLEALATRLESGEDFAAIAEAESEDFGSASSGGELGVFTEQTLPPEFAGALESLSTGEVSEPVETPTSFHIIKLLDTTQAESLVYEEEKARIEAELKLENSDSKFAEILEQLKDVAFNAESLAAVGQELGLPVAESAPFAETGATESGDQGVARFPEVLKAAFSEDVHDHGYASEVLEVADKHYIVIKQKDFVASHMRPIDEVQDQIEIVLKSEKAAAAMAETADSLLTRLRAGEALAEIAKEHEVAVEDVASATRFDQRSVSQVISEVFQHASKSELPLFGDVALADGQVVYQLSAIEAGRGGALSEQEKAELKQSLFRLWAAREFNAYTESLEAEAEIIRR